LKKCPSALLKIPNNRKNVAFLKNQAMSIAVCTLSLMNTAIALKRKFKPAGKLPECRWQKCSAHKGGLEVNDHCHKMAPVRTGDACEMALRESKVRRIYYRMSVCDKKRISVLIPQNPLFRPQQTFLPNHYR
jgi:hypothetical protein